MRFREFLFVQWFSHLYSRWFLQVLNRGLLTGPETKAFRARSLGLRGVKAEPPTCAEFEAELQQEVRQCEEKGELRPELQPLRASNV